MAPQEANHPPPETAVDPKLLALLVCPACHGELGPCADLLRCKGCGLGYPVRDGVPIMLVEEALPPEAGAPPPAEEPES
jgi:hypothetical protein